MRQNTQNWGKTRAVQYFYTKAAILIDLKACKTAENLTRQTLYVKPG